MGKNVEGVSYTVMEEVTAARSWTSAKDKDKGVAGPDILYESTLA